MKYLALSLVITAGLSAAASASLSASGFITYIQNGSVWDYDVHITNTGDTTIGTFWYSWVPGSGFLPDKPTNVSGPSGWDNGTITDFNKSILWQAQTLLQPGESIDGFKFTSVDSPDVLGGKTGNGTPIGTSFVYHEGPFSDDGFEFVVNPVPEPATFAVVGIGLAAIARRRRKS